MVLRKMSKQAYTTTPSYLLEWSGILSSANPSRAVQGAHGTAGVAVAAAMGHALGPGIRVEGSIGGGW